MQLERAVDPVAVARPDVSAFRDGSGCGGPHRQAPRQDDPIESSAQWTSTGDGRVSAGLLRTFSGHQNQRPSRAAIDGVMNDRTMSVSNRSPRPIVVPP